MSTRARLVLATLFGLAAGVSLSLAGRVFAARDSTTSPSRSAASAALPWDDARLLAEVIQRVRENYVDSVDDHMGLAGARHQLKPVGAEISNENVAVSREGQPVRQRACQKASHGIRR